MQLPSGELDEPTEEDQAALEAETLRQQWKAADNG